MTHGGEFEAMRDMVLDKALAHVPFEGWSEKALFEGAKDAGLSPEMALEAFPGGVADSLDYAASRADRAMLAALDSVDLAAMRVRDRIATAIRARLELSRPHREAIQRALTVLARPPYLPLGAKTLWRTVDAIWYAAGDTATDFNFYTKRALLAGVYSATLVYWLNDSSPDYADTWAFLDRRLDDALRLPRLVGGLRDRLAAFPSPFALFKPPRTRHRAR
ncbi:MAG TPA: COQ9 family protein [Alphaproteobacteria bacterium]|nr:COQ9 family protein [Alphaproteobacteria bacterium]